MEYLVTIGIPVYNVEKYIKKSVLSALNQSFSNIEFLLVDDGSKDRSVEIIRDLQANHPRGNDIRLISQPYNIGCWSARNIILKESKGKYIYMMDSDDSISSDCIDKLFSVAEKYDTEATFGSYQKDNNGIFSDGFAYQFRLFEQENEFANYANLKFQITITNYVWNILFRTDFLRKHKLHFPETNFWEDVLFNADFQPLVKRAVLLPDITYTYVIRNNSLSGYEDRDNISIEEIKCHFKNNDYLKKQCIELKGKPYFEMRCAKEMLQTYYSIVAVLRNQHKITPPISSRELRDEMKHPLSLKEILLFKKHKYVNLFFYSLGTLPPYVSVFLMKSLAKHKKLL
jgi:glycosyltransferase involved in cell wall biosynthesis